MTNIRLYKKEDFKMIQDWWIQSNEVAPLEDMLTLDSTFILEVHNKPRMCISAYLTNCKCVAYLENFIKDPTFKDSKNCSKQLVEHAENFVKEKGFRILVCYSYKNKLTKRYEELGYINTLNDLSSHAKELV
jgi:hypothetical protein